MLPKNNLWFSTSIIEFIGESFSILLNLLLEGDYTLKLSWVHDKLMSNHFDIVKLTNK